MIVVLVITIIISSTISAIIMSRILRAQHANERSEDLRRQDEVADLLSVVNENTNEKLDTIHTLVNSNMTAAMQAELDATVRELAMMKEVIALNNAAGRSPSKEALYALHATQQNINELKSTLGSRARESRIAELLPIINKEKEGDV